MRWVVMASVAVLFVLGAGAPRAAEQAQLKTSLDGTGADADASGTIAMKLGPKKSSLALKLSSLDPRSEYEVEVDGIPEASFVTTRSGKAKVGFRTKAKRNQPSLDFDPRGRTIAVSRSGVDVLSVQVASGSLDDGSADERVLIPSTDLAPGARITARYRLRKDGRRDFSIEAERLAAGSYDVFVGGIHRGILVTSGRRNRGELEFRDPVGDDTDKLPLDFDPTGQEITISQGGAIHASGPFLATIPSVNSCTASSTEVGLAAQPGAPSGSAKAELRTEAECKRHFEVELEDVPVGDYDLLVEGVLRGSIHVSTSDSGTHGEIEFETQGSDDDSESNGELPLDFDPSTAAIEIAQAGVTLFAGSLANGTPSGPGACSEPASNVEVALLNTGEDSDAKGKARHRVRDDCDHDFRVEIENLPAGDYALLVGGVNRGEIEVALVAGEFVGELEFDSDPDEPGELLLDFEPRGALIEIRQNARTFLSRLFPPAE